MSGEFSDENFQKNISMQASSTVLLEPSCTQSSSSLSLSDTGVEKVRLSVGSEGTEVIEEIKGALESTDRMVGSGGIKSGGVEGVEGGVDAAVDEEDEVEEEEEHQEFIRSYTSIKSPPHFTSSSSSSSSSSSAAAAAAAATTTATTNFNSKGLSVITTLPTSISTGPPSTRVSVATKASRSAILTHYSLTHYVSLTGESRC